MGNGCLAVFTCIAMHTKYPGRHRPHFWGIALLPSSDMLHSPHHQFCLDGSPVALHTCWHVPLQFWHSCLASVVIGVGKHGWYTTIIMAVGGAFPHYAHNRVYVLGTCTLLVTWHSYTLNRVYVLGTCTWLVTWLLCTHLYVLGTCTLLVTWPLCSCSW